MRVFFVSDLHVEMQSGEMPKIFDKVFPTKDDVVVFAGDIANPRCLKFFASFSKLFENVIYVPGNHEYYRGTYPTAIHLIRAELIRLNAGHVLVMDNQSCTLKGKRFHVATLWTNFAGSPMVEFQAKQWINDFRAIAGMDTTVMKNAFKTSEAFLKKSVKPGDVVVTHYAPHLKSIHEKYGLDTLNRYFVNDCSDVIFQNKPALWIHGHTHSSFDYTVGETRVVCNPHGYGNENVGGWDRNACVEL